MSAGDAKTVSLVGSTGSIGTQAEAVVAAEPDRFRVVALAAQRSVELLAEQARRLRPELVAIGDADLAPALAAGVPAGTEVMCGAEGLEAAGAAAEVVVNGVVGFAGLPVTLAALESGRRLALANKESLIAGAPVVQRARRTPGAQLLPVDSEHCAIHQCLAGAPSPSPTRHDGTEPDRATVARLLVTASGGPFRGRDRADLASVSVEEALLHPTWRMGRKITIDSSTLMNKGLEVIEAHELFGISYDRIDVVVHPQSVVHSMVEFVDGTTIAQLSQPDMRLPIGYAMGWPERIRTPFGAMDWSAGISLSFEPPDRRLFACLDLAYAAGRAGGAAPAWLNAANEVAVAAFLEGQLGWLEIAEVVEDVLTACSNGPMTSVGDVLEADRSAHAPGGDGGGAAEEGGVSTVTPTRAGPAGGQRPSGADGLQTGAELEARAPGATGSGAETTGETPPEPNSAWALVRLAAAVALFCAVFMVLGLTPLLIVIVAIIVMVMVHELGHFATAKWSGMKVTEYFVGFGPRLWSVRRGETEYGFKAIPAGGYVKIPGMSNMEEIDPADEADTYRQKPFHNRIIVASAGSFMHLVMALVLAYIAVLCFGIPSAHVKIAGFSTWPGHSQTAAQAGGLEKGDVITAVDGHPLTTQNQFSDTVRKSAGKPVDLTVERAGKTVHLTVTPQAGHVNGSRETIGAKGKGPTVGLIGVSEATGVFTSEGPVRGVGTAFVDVGRDVALTVRSVPEGIGNLYKDIVNPSQAEQTSAGKDRAVSIIGIGRVATQAEQTGLLYLIEILIAVNIAFAILNMLPMLPLDGGHVAIAVYERIRTRKGQPYYQADAAKLMPVVYAFMGVLLVIVLAAVYLDIAHPIANPFTH